MGEIQTCLNAFPPHRFQFSIADVGLGLCISKIPWCTAWFENYRPRSIVLIKIRKKVVDRRKWTERKRKHKLWNPLFSYLRREICKSVDSRAVLAELDAELS